MRRLRPQVTVEPPARLRFFDASKWPVDPAGYDPDRFRNRLGGLVVGEPHVSLQDWRRTEAVTAWGRARQEWRREHGWPGGLDVVDLLREQIAVRRAST